MTEEGNERQELVRLAGRLGQGDDWLDDAVHDAKGAEAAEINNGGLEAQVDYLCAGLSLEQAKKFLRTLSGKA